MKKFLVISALTFALASSAFARSVVTAPPLVDINGWKKLDEVSYCKASQTRVRYEAFVLWLDSKSFHLYEQKRENEMLVVVRDLEVREGTALHDDLYLYSGKWTKFDLRTEPEVFMQQIAENQAPRVSCPVDY